MVEKGNSGVVIVGAGRAGVQVAHTLRKLGFRGRITVVGEEPCLPYDRPPLSKHYLKGECGLSQILLRQEAAYQTSGIDLRLGARALAIDRKNKVVLLDNGRLGYEKLVLATGARARNLAVPGMGLPGTHLVRTVADIEEIRRRLRPGAHAVVIGGGYIGLETVASLRGLRMTVTLLEAQERVLQRVTGPSMSDFFMRLHREEGVTIRTGETIAAIHSHDGVKEVRFADGTLETADLVIAGIGIQPNVALAEDAGLEVNNGIVIDQFGRTSDVDIHAAGDCASFVHLRYGRFMRLESVQNANDLALVVAKSICGKAEPYEAVPWFWSEQFDVKLQIAGLSDGYDQVVQRGDPTHGRSFTLCYLRNGKLIAVEAVNRPRDFLLGKRVIADDLDVDLQALPDPERPFLTANATETP